MQGPHREQSLYHHGTPSWPSLLFFDDHYPRVDDTRTLGEEAVLRHNAL